jgi:hypothetical protein
MPSRWTIITALVIAVCLTALRPSICVAEDVVHHKDGSITRGKIVEEIPGQSLTIEDRVGNTRVIPIEEVARIERGVKDEATESGGKKSAALSCVLSLLVFPGTGQFYNGDLVKGGIMAGVGVLGLVLMFSDSDSYDDPYYGYYDEPSDWQTIGSVIYLGNWVWSSIDAPLSSNSINRKRGYSEMPQSAPGARLVVARVEF